MAPHRRAHRRAHGQGMVEYAMVLALIALMVIAVLTVVGRNVKSSVCKVSGALEARYSQAVMADAPIAYLPMNDTASAPTSVDLSGNSRNGTYSPSITRSTSPSGGPLACEQENAVVFLEGGGLNLPAFNPTGNTLSLECWFRYSEPAILPYPSICGSANSHINSFQFWMSNTLPPPDPSAIIWLEYPRAPFADTNRSWIPVRTEQWATDGNWHQLVATYDSAQIVVYTDGVQLSSTAYTGGLNTAAPAVPWKAGNGFHGAVAQFAIYDAALTSAQVLTHYRIASGLQ